VPTPTSFILEVTSHWKGRKVSIHLDYDVEIISPLHSGLTPTSLVYLFLVSSSQTPPPFNMEDIFFNLKLDHDLIHFPTLSEEEKRIIETILQGRSTLGLGGWDMIKTMEKLLTFP